MWKYRLAALIAAMSAALPPQAADGVETWCVSDEAGELTVRLFSNGTCSVLAVDAATGKAARDTCTYWIHGW